MIYFCVLLVNSKIQRHGSNIDKQSGHVICFYRVVSTGIGKSTNPRFRENELKKLRSSACCR